MGLCMFIFFLFSFFFFLFSFFSTTILSGPYLWNRYSQRLQIVCAAWSCSLVVHCCLPSNSLHYYYFFFFPPRFCPGHISGAVTRRDSKLSVACWSCGLVVHCHLPSNSLRYFFFKFFFFSATILSGPYLWNRYSQRFQV